MNLWSDKITEILLFKPLRLKVGSPKMGYNSRHASILLLPVMDWLPLVHVSALGNDYISEHA